MRRQSPQRIRRSSSSSSSSSVSAARGDGRRTAAGTGVGLQSVRLARLHLAGGAISATRRRALLSHLFLHAFVISPSNCVVNVFLRLPRTHRTHIGLRIRSSGNKAFPCSRRHAHYKESHQRLTG